MVTVYTVANLLVKRRKHLTVVLAEHATYFVCGLLAIAELLVIDVLLYMPGASACSDRFRGCVSV